MPKTKLIHIVGGGINQIPLVKKAKELGLKVLITDMYSNPPAKEYADFFSQINTTDKEATLKEAQKYNIDAIVTDGTDVSVPTVAYIAEKLNLYGISYETSLKFTDKYKMREALKSKSENMPRYKFFLTIDGVEEYVNNMASFVVKPINSQGSKGVMVLDRFDKNKILSSFFESNHQGILIEEYIDGQEVAVESYTADGKTNILAISRKDHYKENDCIDMRVNFLSDIDETLEKNIIQLNSEIIALLGLKNGITHAEYRLKNNNIYLMEIAARGAGGNISSLVIPYLTDFDTSKTIILNSLGIKTDLIINNYKNKFAIVEFFNFQKGKVKDITCNLNAIEKTSCFFSLDLKKDDEIKDIKDSRDRKGYFVVCDSDRDKLFEKRNFIHDNINITYAGK